MRSIGMDIHRVAAEVVSCLMAKSSSSAAFKCYATSSRSSPEGDSPTMIM